MGKKLFAMLAVIFMLCGCATKMNTPQKEKWQSNAGNR